MTAATDPFIVGQVPAELNRMRDLYIERAPKRVLEIGVFYGGTLREWLANAAPNATIVAVDPEHQNPNRYDGWKKPSTTLIVGTGRSQDVVIEAQIMLFAPFDWIFIDGDHAQDSVDADVALALQVAAPGGLVLLHDIAAEGYPPTPPRLAFDKLAETHEAWEIVETPPEEYGAENGHGIGVVQL